MRLAAPLLIASLGMHASLVHAEPEIDDFLIAAFQGGSEADAALERIEAAGWQDGYAAIVVDLLDLLQRTSFAQPRGWLGLRGLVVFLEAQTGQAFGGDIGRWRRWVWSLPYEPHSQYGEFKGALYAALDPRFADFFVPPVRSSIRLDEIQWGGVAVNGIPPLDHPDNLNAASAEYLDDDNIVFGLFVAGAARAYPKRILAWHELARDELGGRELTIVYCTLCGTVIPYESNVGGKLRRFGTSGLLYQSNKLMFDDETKSLWSSLTGTPVVGPLVGSGLELNWLPVVTTTWGEWRSRHPETTVLSLDTGFRRDYREGAAYRQYFATDELMFDVSLRDQRLANKAEVFTLRSGGENGSGDAADAADAGRPIAISVERLAAQRVYQVETGEPAIVVITDSSGASRAYASGEYRFAETLNDGAPRDEGVVRDSDGGIWEITEDALVASRDSRLQLPRVPAHRSFWFGWVAQHPDTILIR